MPKKADSSERVIRAAFELAATRGWRRLSLGDIAEAAGLSLAELHALYGSRAAIVLAFSDRMDDEVLSALDPDLDGEPVRDRLFAVMMHRFDAMTPYKEGLRAIVGDCSRDPEGAICGLFRLARSVAWMLEAAGLTSTGLRGRLRVKVLAAIYLCTFRIWLADDSDDMSRTMATLDRQLGRVDSLLGVLDRLCSRPRGADNPAPEAEPAS